MIEFVIANEASRFGIPEGVYASEAISVRIREKSAHLHCTERSVPSTGRRSGEVHVSQTPQGGTETVSIQRTPRFLWTLVS